MASNEPPFPPLAITTFGLFISALGWVILAMNDDRAIAQVTSIAALGLGGLVTFIGAVAVAVELGMKRATFRR